MCVYLFWFNFWVTRQLKLMHLFLLFLSFFYFFFFIGTAAIADAVQLKEFQSRHNKPEAVVSNDKDILPDASNVFRNEEIINPNEPVEQNPDSISMNFEALDPVSYNLNAISRQDSYVTEQPFNWQSQSIHNLNATSTVTASTTSQYFSNADSNSNPPQSVIQPVNNFIEPNNANYLPDYSTNIPNAFNAYYTFNTPCTQATNIDNGLEQRNQELASLLQIEKLRTHELGVKVTQQHAQIEELTAELEQIKGDKSNLETINKLKSELEAHSQTIKILVSDKAELLNTVARHQHESNEYVTQCEELQGRLNASRHRVGELERELSVLDKTRKDSSDPRHANTSEIETLQGDNKRLQKLYQEACDETAEIQHQLVLKAREIEDLKNALHDKGKELELVNLRVEQLTAGDLIQTDVTLQTEREEKLAVERQMIELQNTISELTSDRDRIEQQYQAYVQHLTKESSSLQQRIQDLSTENTRLTAREESLLAHVSELERNFQKQINTQQRLAALRNDDKVIEATENTGKSSEEMHTLKEKVAQLEKENTDLNVGLFFELNFFLLFEE